MKSNSKMIMISMILLVTLALAFAPVSARGDTIANIANGDVIFVYENDLDLSDIMDGSVDKLCKYVDDDIEKAMLKRISVSDETSFDVIGSVVDGDFGIYYAVTGTTPIATDYVMIAEPKATLDVVLAAYPAESINGGMIVNGDIFKFEIVSPDVGSSYKYGSSSPYTYPQYVKIEVTTPSGGKTYELDSTNLTTRVNGTRIYTNNVTVDTLKSGLYTAVLKWDDNDANDFKEYVDDSNVVSFTVESKSIAIELSETEIIHDNDFVVTLRGSPKSTYYMFVENANLGDATDYPVFLTSQVDVTIADDSSTEGKAVSATVYTDYLTRYPKYDSTTLAYGSVAKVVTDVMGIAVVGFETSSETNERAFTIRTYLGTDKETYDTEKLTVLAGDITITADGSASYYLGSEVRLSGTNTDTGTVYLFITGPNLDSVGDMLSNVTKKCVTGTPTTFVDVDVDSDDLWDYNWDTSDIELDTGSYTIYAVSSDKNKDDIKDGKYDTQSVLFRKPFITASTEHTSIAKGDKLYIEGTAEGEPSTGIAIWMLGKNYYERYTETVNSDSTYKKEIASTEDFASGQYFIVVQHPMYNNVLDITIEASDAGDGVKNEVTGDTTFYLSGSNALQGTDAATALVDAIESSNIDDTYYKLSVMVEEPWIRINSIGSHAINSEFVISGTTNLNSENDLIITVSSASFEPTAKQVSSEASGTSGNAVVTPSENYNVWSFDVNTASWVSDMYIVNVESIVSSTMQSATFELTSTAVTPAPAPVPAPAPASPATPTAVPTQVVPVAEPTATPTPDETSTPGFGALIALIGLGGVAVLVVRKE